MCTGTTNDGVNPAVSGYSSGVITINAAGTSQFSDDFSTDTTGDYTLTDTWTGGELAHSFMIQEVKGSGAYW